MASQDQLNRALVELQLLERLVTDYQARLLTIERSIEEHENALKLIEEVKKNVGKIPILVPIGAGSFIKAEMHNVETIHINVGAGVIIEKPLEESQQILTKRNETLQQLRDTISKRLDEALARMQQLRQYVEEAIARQQGGRT